MLGDVGGKFRPNDRVTREELAVILVRALKAQSAASAGVLAVADQKQISGWARGSVQSALERDLMRAEGEFRPRQALERQEIAEILLQTFHPDQESGASLQNITQDRVTINGVTYSIATQLRGILNEQNKEILQGASIRVNRDGSTVRSIAYLEIKRGGEHAAKGQAEFSGNAVLDGNGATIGGKLKVAADFVSVKNLTINGDLEIGKEVENDFYSRGITVRGKTLVNGGDSNTVVFEDATMNQVGINKQDVQVQFSGASVVPEVSVTADAVIVGDSTTVIDQVNLQNGAKKVDLQASTNSLVVSSEQTVELSGQGNVGKLVIDTAAPVNLNQQGSVTELSVVKKAAQLTIGQSMQIADMTLPAGVQATAVVQNTAALAQVQQINGAPNALASQAPTVVNPVSSKILTKGTGSLVIDVSNVFAGAVKITAMSKNMAVATVSLPSGSTMLTVNAGSAGTAIIQLTGYDSSNKSTTHQFTVTVNLAPTGKTIPDQNLIPGTSGQTLNLLDFFEDADGDVLSFMAVSADPSVATATVNGNQLTLLPVAGGTTEVTVVAEDGRGGKVSKKIRLLVNSAPTVNSLITDRHVTLGNSGDISVDLTNVFTDVDGDTITLEAVSGDPTVATVGLVDRLLTVTPVAGGESVVTVTAKDGKGGTVSTTFRVVVNRAPQEGAISDRTILLEDGDVEVSGLFTDADGDILTLTATSQNTGIVTTSVNGSKVTLTPVAAGTTTVTVSADDSRGGTASKTFMLTVNRKPISAGTVTDQLVTIGSEQDIDLTNLFSDPDGDALTLTAVAQDTTLAALDITGKMLKITPQAAGSTTVTVTATDGRGGFVTKTFNLQVNRAPVVTQAIADRATTLGTGDLTVDLSGVFGDLDGDALVLTAVSKQPGLATVSVAGNQLTITPLAGGTATIEITADDGKGGKVVESFDVAINRAPQVGTINDLTLVLEAGVKKFDLTSAFQDADGDAWTLSAVAADASIAGVSVNGKELTVTPGVVGSTDVTVSADDGRGGVTSKTFKITVNPNQSPQVASGVPAKKVSLAGGDVLVDVANAFSDPDGESLTYTVTSSDDSIAQAAVSGDKVTITPVAIGSATITVTARDGAGATVQTTFVVTVANNENPVAVQTIPKQIIGGSVPANQFSLENAFQDADGDTLIYTVTAADGSLVDATVNGNMLTLSPKAASGLTTVTVTADDGKGGTATLTIPVQAVQVVDHKIIKTKNGVPDVSYDLSAFFPTQSLTMYNQPKGAMTPDGTQALNGKVFKMIPSGLGTSAYWIVADDGKAAFIEVVVEAQQGSDIFFSEYLQGTGDRVALEIYHDYGGAAELATGLSVKMYQYDTVSKTMKVTEIDRSQFVLQVWAGTSIQIINTTFYDFFDLTSAPHYSGELPLTVNGYVNCAFELIKDGEVLDIIGDKNWSPGVYTPILPNGGTIVRKKGIVRGSSVFSMNGEWDLYPKDSFQFIGRHTP